MTDRYDVLIVGAGHAGAQAAITLRQRKFQGSIGLLGDEPHPPYERPPLSKEYLSGDRTFERILIRPADFWRDKDIELLLGRRVVAVDPDARRITLQDQTTLGYRSLIWATGGRPRRLSCSGHDLIGLHTVRMRDDVDAMARELPTSSQVVVIGGGYIGLEAAAVLAGLGKSVTVLETANRVLSRVAGEPLSRFYEAEHRAHGVDVRLGVTVECIEERSGRASGVRLTDGTFVPADMVIVGIGILPSIQVLLDAGIECNGGILVDAIGRTSVPDVYAIGDCAAHVSAYAAGAVIRLESVQNATDQATTVANALTGLVEPYEAVPWFWSNQYDLRLQTIGLSIGYDATIVRGSPESRAFSIVYLKRGQVIALDCVNRTRDYIQGRALVKSRAKPAIDALQNPNVELKSLA